MNATPSQWGYLLDRIALIERLWAKQGQTPQLDTLEIERANRALQPVVASLYYATTEPLDPEALR